MSPRLVMLRSQSDERLVGLARAGNERAFAAIVERYRPELQAFARGLCSDGRSEDVVQQAFLSAFAALSAGAEVRHLRGWLYRIVRNAANRPAGPLCVPLDRAAVSVNSVEDVVQQRALAMSTLSELARLPARQRQAMIGTALDGRPRAEIASSMGLSEGAVRQLVHRARTALRGAVTAVTPWPVARWLAAASPDVRGTAELAAGAGAASSGGLAIKLGALLASGTLLTGAAIDLPAAPAHRGGGARSAASVQPRARGARAPGVVLAAQAAPGSAAFVSDRAPAGAGILVAQAGGGALRVATRPDRHAGASGQSDGRGGGRPGRRHDGNGGGAGGGDSGGEDGRGGAAASSRANSGSDDQGRDGGPSQGDRPGAGGDSGSGPRSDGGSDRGGDAQMASDSHSFDRAGHGSLSDLISGSGQGSGSGDRSGATGSGSAVAGTGASGSSDGGSGSGASGSGGTDGGSAGD